MVKSDRIVKTMVKREIIDTVNRYIMVIPKELGLRSVYLFGSYAKGTANEDSDIDIALVIDEMPDFFRVQRELMQLRRNIDLRIEPHPFYSRDFLPSSPFANEVMTSGIRLPLQ